MTREEIERYLGLLGERLAARGERGEILIADGAAMLLTVGNRDVTRDIDAYLGHDPQIIRELAREVAADYGLPDDWINDAIKVFFYTGAPPNRLWAQYGTLDVYVVDPRYLFVMKAIAARPRDIEDMAALLEHVGLKSRAGARRLIQTYIPSTFITPRAEYAIDLAFSALRERRRRG